jgi:hypothetical protein
MHRQELHLQGAQEICTFHDRLVTVNVLSDWTEPGCPGHTVLHRPCKRPVSILRGEVIAWQVRTARQFDGVGWRSS